MVLSGLSSGIWCTQKNALEPILVTLKPGASTEPDDPHEGEEFGYVLSGTITLILGDQKRRVRRGDAFYFRPTGVHYLTNSGKTEGKVLWVSILWPPQAPSCPRSQAEAPGIEPPPTHTPYGSAASDRLPGDACMPEAWQEVNTPTLQFQVGK